MTDPQNGSTTTGGSYTDKSFYWGGYGSDISTLTNRTQVPNIDKTTQALSTIGAKDWVRIPSNYVQGSTFSGGVVSLLDVGAKYYVSNEDVDYQSEVFVEGSNVSIPLFLLCWIMSHTLNKYFSNPLYSDFQ